MKSNIGERPTVPFGLSLAGLIISAVATLLVGIAGLGMSGAFGMGSMMGSYHGTGMMAYSQWGMYGWRTAPWILMPIMITSISVAAFGVFMMNSSRLEGVRIGSVLVLVAAVLAFPTAFGFVVGSVLLVLGGVLGLTWSPGRQTML